MDQSSTVGQIARLTGVSVRTLHHYDQIGLVSSAERSDSGYRLYGPREVARLQEVLLFRELVFGLGEIKQMVDRPGYDRLSALARQRRMLDAKAEHILAMVDAVDAAIEAERHGTGMSSEEMLGVFGEFDPAEHDEEARERWGETDAYRESSRRTAGYSRQHWERMKRESGEIDDTFISLMGAGAAPDSPEAMAAAERHREHITRWFYDCTPAMHAGLGQMYVADPRFAANIDEAEEGLAAYMAAAIAANTTG